MQTGWPAEGVPAELQVFVQHESELTVEAGCILRGIRIVLLATLRKRVLEELHQGHPGVVGIKSLARSHIWWPGLDSDIEERVKSCMACQAIKNAPAVTSLHPWAWPERPWDRIHVDFAGPP